MNQYIIDMNSRKIVDFGFNIMVIILVLLVANYFMKLVVIPEWLMLVIFLVSALLFFIRTWFRLGRR